MLHQSFQPDLNPNPKVTKAQIKAKLAKTLHEATSIASINLVIEEFRSHPKSNKTKYLVPLQRKIQELRTNPPFGTSPVFFIS